MMGELVLRNLLHRPVRTFIGVLAIGFEVMLIVFIVGLTSGLLAETAKRIEGVGADIMLQPSSAGILIGMSNAPMPTKPGDKITITVYPSKIDTPRGLLAKIVLNGKVIIDDTNDNQRGRHVAGQ